MELYERGVELHFLKEPSIDTTTYKEAVPQIALTGSDADIIIDGVNKYLVKLAERQIELAFEQAQKEVDDLSQRTKEGLVTARLNGKKIGNIKGKKYISKIEKPIKANIYKHSKDFLGTLKDIDVIKICQCSVSTYYKYKKELINELNHFSIEG